jgi:hypothetical protein
LQHPLLAEKEKDKDTQTLALVDGVADEPAASADTLPRGKQARAAKATSSATFAPPPVVSAKRARREQPQAATADRSTRPGNSSSDNSGDGKADLAKLLSESSKIKLRFSATRSASDSLLATVQTVRAWEYAQKNLGDLIKAKAALSEEYQRQPFAAVFFSTQSNLVKKRSKDAAQLTVDLTGLQTLLPLCDALDTEIDILQQMHDARMKVMSASQSKSAKGAR